MCVRLRVQIFPMWTWQEDRVRFGFFLQMCAITSSLFLIGRLGIAYKSNYICEWLSEGLDWIGGSWILGDHVFPRYWDDEKKVKQSNGFGCTWHVLICVISVLMWLRQDSTVMIKGRRALVLGTFCFTLTLTGENKLHHARLVSVFIFWSYEGLLKIYWGNELNFFFFLRTKMN